MHVDEIPVSVEKLSPKAGDIIVLRHPAGLPETAMKYLHETGRQVADGLDDVRVLLLPEGFDMQVASKDEIREMLGL